MKPEHIGFWSSLLLHSFTALAFFTFSANFSQSSVSTKPDTDNAGQLIAMAKLSPRPVNKTQVSDNPPRSFSSKVVSAKDLPLPAKEKPELLSDNKTNPELPTLAKAEKPVNKNSPKKKKNINTTSKTKLRSSGTRQPQPKQSTVQPKVVPSTDATASKTAGLPADYESGVRLSIMRHKYFPARSRRKKQTGTVVVRFRVHADGRYDNLAIHHSSGHKLLDQAAMDAVRKVGKFPPFPTSSILSDKTYRIPIVFKL